MNTKKFTLAFFAYFILVAIIAMVWHLVLFKEQYVSFRMRAEPLIQLGLLSMLIQAAITAYLYPVTAKENAPVKEGLKFGLLIGIFMGSYGVLAEAGKYDVGSVPQYILLEGLFFIIQYSVVGIIIGLIYGKSFKK